MLKLKKYLRLALYPFRLQERLKYIKLQILDSSFDYESLISKLTMYCHALDKSLNAIPWEIKRGYNNYINAEIIFNKLNETQFSVDRRYFWCLKIFKDYQVKNKINQVSINKYNNFDVEFTDESQVNEIFYKRNSIRNFTKQLIPDNIIKKMSNAAFHAPSSCNRQTLNIIAIKNDQILKVNVLKKFKGFTAFSDNIPVIFVILIDLRPYSFPSEIFTPYVDAGLGVENLLLEAGYNNLSTVILTWGSHTKKDDKDLRKLLNIPSFYEIICGVVCGYPSDKINSPTKKSAKTALRIY